MIGTILWWTRRILQDEEEEIQQEKGEEMLQEKEEKIQQEKEEKMLQEEEEKIQQEQEEKMLQEEEEKMRQEKEEEMLQEEEQEEEEKMLQEEEQEEMLAEEEEMLAEEEEMLQEEEEEEEMLQEEEEEEELLQEKNKVEDDDFCIIGDDETKLKVVFVKFGIQFVLGEEKGSSKAFLKSVLNDQVTIHFMRTRHIVYRHLGACVLSFGKRPIFRLEGVVSKPSNSLHLLSILNEAQNNFVAWERMPTRVKNWSTFAYT
jgi:chemotaxis protein histidine kinase CheA